MGGISRACQHFFHGCLSAGHGRILGKWTNTLIDSRRSNKSRTLSIEQIEGDPV